MITRAGTPEDSASAVEVWRSVLAAQGRRPSAGMLAETTGLLESGLLVVAEDDGLIAMAVGTPGPTRDLELELVAVLSDLQGQGIGAATVEALADAAWERGLRTMSAWTDQPGFLEAIGFTRTGRARDDVLELTAELEAPVRDVMVADGIRLGQLLKLAELVETGAEAKSLLADGAVAVNGEVDVRRGRQLVHGDEVRARDQAVRVVLLTT